MRFFRNALLFTAIVATSASAQAQRHFAEPQSLPGEPLPIHKLAAPREATMESLRPQPYVNTGGGAAAFIFPVVGSVAGAYGTYFKSETTIVNNLNRSQDVAIYFFPSGGNNNCAVQPVIKRLDAGSWYVWTDFVNMVFGKTGLGAAAVLALNSSHTNVDTTASLDGFSRIWTPIPGSSGSASQSFPAEALEFDGARRYAYGLRQDANFRTNVGIFNYDDSTRTFDVIINGLNGSGNLYSVDVKPCTVVLSGAPAGNYGLFELSIAARDGRALWYGFGSSNDNVSGDSWSSVPR